MAKPRVNIRISTKLYAQLCEAAAKPGVTKTAIVEDALRAWFDPEARSVLEERLLIRIDAYDQRQADMERDLAFTYETLAHYVYYWLTRTEPIPEGERDIAHALGRKRLDYFLDQVARKLGASREHPESAAKDLRLEEIERQ
ncbi:hypothetical protein [Parvularcula marina]|uniref:hypothetical protein n=1 Tax=Parvularcula marina TaxID=2292771 RepID=UPI003518CB31